MKLYDSKLAPNARRVRIFLAEKGMSVPMVDMDLARLDQKTTAFSVLNPFQTVPVLELDDGEQRRLRTELLEITTNSRRFGDDLAVVEL